MHILIDSTYRLVVEGHTNLLVGCVDVAQKWHTIGYGVCSSESEEQHAHIMKCLRDEVNSLVAAKIARQESF